MNTAAEDVAIKTRLLYDTRSLRKLYRKFHSFAHYDSLEGSNGPDSTTSSTGPDGERLTRKDALDQYLVELELFQTTSKKYQLYHTMSGHEVSNYKADQIRIDKEINEAIQEIAKLKVELEAARIRKQNKIEYDQISREVIKWPTRTKTAMNMSALHAEIERLDAEFEILNRSEEYRRKHVAAAVGVIHQLQDTIQQARELEEKELEERDRASQANVNGSQNQMDEEEGEPMNVDEEEGAVDDGWENDLKMSAMITTLDKHPSAFTSRDDNSRAPKVRSLSLYALGLTDLSALRDTNRKFNSLCVICLSRNRLTTLESLIHLPSLQEIYVQYNYISVLDGVLCQGNMGSPRQRFFPALKVLDLRGNPLMNTKVEAIREEILKAYPSIQRCLPVPTLSSVKQELRIPVKERPVDKRKSWYDNPTDQDQIKEAIRLASEKNLPDTEPKPPTVQDSSDMKDVDSDDGTVRDDEPQQAETSPSSHVPQQPLMVAAKSLLCLMNKDSLSHIQSHIQTLLSCSDIKKDL